MKLKIFLVAGTGIALSASAAVAQSVGIGSTMGTAVGQMAATISKIVSSHSGGVQLRTQAMAGTQKYIPVVNAGELQFGIANVVQTTMAFHGTGLSAGKDYKDLRLAATLMAFRNGLLVRNDSDIKKIADLKGKRVPSGFKGAPLFYVFMDGMLANGGLTLKDVTEVPAIALRQSWDLLKQGKVDVVITGAGAAPTREMNARVPSGVRFLDMDTSGPGPKKTLNILKGTYYVKMQPSKSFPAIKGPTTTLGYDFLLFTSKAVSSDVVGKVVKALYENEANLKAASPLWKTFTAKGMSKDQNLAYHPGAEAFYKKAGAWKR
jgi:hypothetical protein